jgi:hypothetical protein
MSGAWIFQDDKQVKKVGEQSASWYVGWIDPEGERRCKSCGPGERGQRNATKLRRKIEAQLLTGTYQGETKLQWSDFRKEWEDKIGAAMEYSSRRLYLEAFDHFERLTHPARIYFITAQYIDHYKVKRREERGKRPGSKVSVATINRELRHLRAALTTAKE